MSDTVSYKLPEYLQMIDRWQLIADCIEGQHAVKAKGDIYLPRPGIDVKSVKSQARYKDYLKRAVFYNVTGRTLNGLIGQAFKESPKQTDIPKSLEFINKDIDGDEVSIRQQSQKALFNVLAFGRAGLWVDFPRREEGTTVKQYEAGEAKPNVSLYKPQSVINWWSRNGKLSLVVIKETVEKAKEDNRFKFDYITKYKALWLVDNEYKVEIWVKSTPNGNAELEQSIWPTNYDGKRFNYIPFYFIGSENNSYSVDRPPIEDLANLNIGHYVNSADYEESVYRLGQPTYWFSGLDRRWVKEELKGKIELGALGGVLLPQGGRGDILQAKPNTLAFEAMEKKEQQMTALGARLIEKTKVVTTATEVALRYAGETSQLALAANNVSSAYEDALRSAQEFLEEPSEFSYRINTDYATRNLDANERAELLNEWLSGAILTEELREELKRVGVATVPYEKYLKEIKTDNENKNQNSKKGIQQTE